MKRSSLFLLTAGAFFSLAAADPQPVFQATFDRDFNAVCRGKTHRGNHPTPLNMETISVLLQQGIKGKAAKIGLQENNGKKENSHIHYHNPALNAEQGTISFWLKPLNWNFNDNKFHAFIQGYSPQGSLLIYKYKTTKSISVFYGNPQRGDNGDGYISFGGPNGKWEQGEFRHVVLTWNKERIELYLDGIRITHKNMPARAVFKKFNLFSVGFLSINGWNAETGEALMDDLKVYDCALSGAEVEKLFTSYGVKKVDKSNIPIKISAAKLMASPDEKAIDLTFSLSRTTVKGGGFPVEMEVQNNGKTVLKKVLTSASADYRWAFDLAKWKKGEYLVYLRPRKEMPQDKIEPHRPLLFSINDYKEITDHSVPAPWKPVVFKNNEFSSILQKTAFGKGLFPKQLVSDKTPLLRGEMQFIRDGKALSGKASSRIVEKHPDYQVLERTISGKDFKLTSRCRFEFDGLMWFEVTLTPKGKTQIRNARIQLPLRKETSTLYNCFVRDYFNLSGHFAGKLTAPVKRDHYDTSTNGKLPVLWMGNEERGLYYFTADQAGRRLKNRAETVRLDPGKAGALFTINLIDYASVIDKPVTWRFGLQVTPSRPYNRERLLWRSASGYFSRVGNVTWFPWAKIHNVPDARFKKDNYETMRRHLTAGHRVPIFHYFAGFSVSPESPALPQYTRQWGLTPPAPGTEADSYNREWRYVFVCVNSPSYRSYYLQSLDKCIRDLKMDNLYFDNDLSYYCANEKHGCGWRDEHGKLYPTSNVLGAREMAKGCYRVLRKNFPQGRIVRHLTQTPEPPLVSFTDIVTDGESFVDNVCKDENYFNVFKPDYFRASFMGVQFGAPNLYLPQFHRAFAIYAPEKLKLAKAGKLKNQQLHQRHLQGYVFCHDSNIWACNGVYPSPFWKIMDEAGITKDSPFWGYWNSKNPVKKLSPATERVMVSSYAATQGVLAAVLNDTDKPVVIKLKFDAGQLGTSPEVTDAENGQKIDPSNFQLPPREFRMLNIRKK